MRTQYPPGPILGPGYEANTSHDGNVQPDEVTEDVLPEILEELKQRFYDTKVKVTEAESLAIVTETTAGADLGLGKGGFFFVRSNHANLSHTHHY